LRGAGGDILDTKKKESIVLTFDEAVEAVCADLRQYVPQIFLLCSIIRLGSRGQIAVKRDKEGAWVGLPGNPNMQWMDGPGLVEYTCAFLKDLEPDPELLSSLCNRVFQNHSSPETDPDTGMSHIRIETRMEDFSCRQCGTCCRSLEYHRDVTEEDVALWRKLGRTDILKHVGVFKREGRETGYRIWVKPGTLELEENCPFLQKVPHRNVWECQIQDVKPGICRQYPATRKHAMMTGCKGFENPD
jgi:Fe-S-cluster containining protein